VRSDGSGRGWWQGGRGVWRLGSNSRIEGITCRDNPVIFDEDGADARFHAVGAERAEVGHAHEVCVPGGAQQLLSSGQRTRTRQERGETRCALLFGRV
jgi:hypothetical protein